MSTEKTVGRNDPCPCGSGRKYKQCCLEKDEAAERKARAKAAKEAAKAKPGKTEEPEKDEAHAGPPRDSRSGPHPPSGSRPDQPWKRGAGNAHPSQRKGMHRKIGSK